MQCRINKLDTVNFDWDVIASMLSLVRSPIPQADPYLITSHNPDIIFDNSPLPTHGQFSIKIDNRKLATTHTWRVFDSKSNSNFRHYPLTASSRFKIIFDNSPLPTHGQFLIQNQIRKLVSTHSRRVLDSKSNWKTCHYPHMASFGFKIKFKNSSLRTHGEFSIQNQIPKLVTNHTRRVFNSKSNSKTRHYALMASFRFKIIFKNSPLPTHGEFLNSKSNSKTRHYALTASFRFRIIFENLPLPTHGEFLIQNQIRKLVTTHSRRVFDSKSYSKTCHYPHMASF